MFREEREGTDSHISFFNSVFRYTKFSPTFLFYRPIISARSGLRGDAMIPKYFESEIVSIKMHQIKNENNDFCRKSK